MGKLIMLSRDNITIQQMEELISELTFTFPTGISKRTLRLPVTAEELQQKYQLRFGQVVYTDQARLIVVGADAKNVWLYNNSRNSIIKMDSLNGNYKLTRDIAPREELADTLYTRSDIKKYLINLGVGRYRLAPIGDHVALREATVLGEGADAIVHKVVKNNETIACKVLREKEPGYSDELQMLQFLTDYTPDNHLMRLKYFAFDPTGREQLVFEFMSMGDLEAYWQPSNPDYSHENCYHILYRVSCGMQLLHQLNVIHRDIRPANIYLMRDTNGNIQARIGDFGFAQFSNQFSNQQILGTPNYFAPELWEEYVEPYGIVAPEVNSTFASDIYAFGITVYEVVVRHMVYPEVKSIAEMRETVLDKRNSPSHDITKSDPRVSIKLISIFTDCTSYDKSQRPSATAIKQSFECNP